MCPAFACAGVSSLYVIFVCVGVCSHCFEWPDEVFLVTSAVFSPTLRVFVAVLVSLTKCVCVCVCVSLTLQPGLRILPPFVPPISQRWTAKHSRTR